MNRLLAATLVLLSATVFLPGSAHAASTRVSSGVQQQSATLYQAQFKTKGLKGWTVRGRGSGWQVNRKGIVTFDGLPSELFAPFRSGSVRNFAVQATIKTVGKPTTPFSGYGLIVRGTASAFSGIFGGFFYSVADGGIVAPLLMWTSGGTSDDVSGATATLHPGYNTYRLEVRDTDYTLLVNGQQIVQFKITDFTGGARVGIIGMEQKLQVSSFKVTRLQAAAPLPTLPPVKAIDLDPADVPSVLQSVGGHYSTNELVSRLANIPLATLVSWGRIIGYEAHYLAPTPPTSGPFYLIGFVDALTSSQGAKQDLTSDWTVLQKRWTGNTTFAAGDLSGLGEEAHQLAYDFSDSSGNYTRVGVLFRRTTYEVVVVEDFIRGTVSRDDMVKQDTALAKIIDGRIQHSESGV